MAPWSKKKGDAAAASTAADSSALRELKETVKAQSAEIAKLKRELSKKGDAGEGKKGVANCCRPWRSRRRRYRY